MSDETLKHDDHGGDHVLVPADLPPEAGAARRPSRGPKHRGMKRRRGGQPGNRSAERHGIFSRDLVIPGLENAEDREAFRGRIFRDRKPVGELQVVCAEMMVDAAWRLDRVRRYETAEYAFVYKGETTPCLPRPDVVDRIIKYEAHLTRIFDRAWDMLDELQKQARGEVTPTARVKVDVQGALGAEASRIADATLRLTKTPKRIPGRSEAGDAGQGHPEGS